MICLNEEDYIQGAIASIAPFTDKLVIVDGGSTDNTQRAIAEVCKDLDLDYRLDQHKWANDFAKQRQYALDLVPEHFDWWFRIDADEQWGQLIRDNFRGILTSLPKECQAVKIKQVNLVDVDQVEQRFLYSASRGGWESHPRIFRNIRFSDGNPAWRWQGQVHEYCQLLTRQGLQWPDPIACWNVNSVHFGWLDNSRREDREGLYEQIPGSGFVKGSLIERTHVVREMWQGLI